MFNRKRNSLLQKKSGIYLASSLYDGLEDNNLNQVKALLKEKHANPNILLPSYGISPFHLVIGNESEAFAEEVTKLFLRYGGDPNVKSVDGMTPVHVAAAWGRVRVLELLLANGGDPLCTDDEGHTPFNYALEGSYFEAVSSLAKFSCKTQNEYCDDDDDDDDETGSRKSKVRITLEKIFINQGNILAEYIPSEIDLTDQIAEDNEKTSEYQNGLYGNKSSYVPYHFPVKKEFSNSTYDVLHDIPYSNITFRRRPRAHHGNNNSISPILPRNIVSELKPGFIKDEEKCVKNITRRISDSFETTTESWASKKLNDEIKNKQTKKLISFLPQPKLYENLSKRLNTRTSKALLETSIISKSPNFHINFNIKHNNRVSNALNLLESKSLTDQMSSNQLSDSSNASSTPRKNSKEAQCQFIERRYLGGENKDNIDRNLLNLSYNDSCFVKDVVRNLNYSYDDDYDKENSKLINTDILINNKAGERNLGVKINPGSTKKSDLLCPPKNLKNTERDKTEDSNKEEKGIISFPDKIKSILENTISSTSTSNYLSIKSELSSQEKLDSFYESDSIYEENKTFLVFIPKRSNESWSSDGSIKLPHSVQNEKDNSESKVKVKSKMDCSDSEINETPLRSFSFSISNDSFVTVEEHYHYIDPEKKKAFLERRLCVIPKLEESNKYFSDSSYLDEMPKKDDSYLSKAVYKSVQGRQVLTNFELRNRLIRLGEQPGPITSTTYHVYLKRLIKLETNVDFNTQIQELSLEHEFSLLSTEKNELPDPWGCNLQPFQDLEDRVFKEFETLKPNRRYRGGVAKSYFNYILLDPRITNNLPRNGRHLSPGQRWKIFLEAIFYIGKGKATRPAAHLYEAFDYWFKNKSDEPSKKTKKILDIWWESKGVICLHVYMNRMEEEAFTREAAMIDAVGLDKLTNCVRGNYYGIITTLTNLDKVSIGNYLLYKAMEIFMFEGERQLYPQNIS